jgi:hypothetical protein
LFFSDSDFAEVPITKTSPKRQLKPANAKQATSREATGSSDSDEELRLLCFITKVKAANCVVPYYMHEVLERFHIILQL